jgi:F0F1-type ATP synthase epsilon subunit
MKHQASSQQFNVVARAPFHKYYEGPAKVVSAGNRIGQFDILPGHADFFSVLTAGEVIIETDKEAVNFQIKNGIINVRGQEVMLFVNM